ncbi:MULTISPECIES: hypothetical protein [unclassified Streptomyces]|uniref:hypothetical protein n=1 Tax=unclassified Streptomyces TaxID=2593676 RepID=UPI0033BEB808
MPGSTSARPSARPSAPYARAVAAAVLAVTALITAANAGPAGHTETTPVSPTARHDMAERH